MSELLSRTRTFALRCLKVADAMPAKTGARAISFQLSRSGTSVAANYRAARRARSKAEFLANSDHSGRSRRNPLLAWPRGGGWLPVNLPTRQPIQEADELTAMLVASLKTAKKPR